MATRNKVQKRCEELGATLDDSSTPEYFDINITAPNGKRFACDHLHTLAHFQYKGFGREAVAEFWSDIADRLAAGTEDCTESHCDSCDDNH